MAMTYFEHEGVRIYEIAYTMGDGLNYFCFIDGDRHHFRTLFAAKSYITRIKNP